MSREIEITLPESEYVEITSVKLNLRCRKCLREFGKRSENVGGHFYLNNDYQICTACTMERLGLDDKEIDNDTSPF